MRIGDLPKMVHARPGGRFLRRHSLIVYWSHLRRSFWNVSHETVQLTTTKKCAVMFHTVSTPWLKEGLDIRSDCLCFCICRTTIRLTHTSAVKLRGILSKIQSTCRYTNYCNPLHNTTTSLNRPTTANPWVISPTGGRPSIR